MNRDDERLESRRLAGVLRAGIEGGAQYPPGTRLPSYRQLAEAHGVARNTVGAAIKLLEQDGLVIVRPASGAYVVDPTQRPARRDVRAELTDLRDQLQRTKRELTAAQQTVTALLESLPLEGAADE